MHTVDAFEDHLEFFINQIEQSETGDVPEDNRIDFRYGNPDIDIATGGNFKKHEIIGGATVRQRIGDKPLEIDIQGVCTESTAKDVDLLRNAKSGFIHSNRLPNSSVEAHFVSVSTNPMSSKGSTALTDEENEELYNFTLNCVEVVQ